MRYFKFWLLAGICLLGAAFLYFALIGYEFLSYILIAIATAFVFFGILRVCSDAGRAVRLVKTLRVLAIICILLGLILFIALESLIIGGAKTDAESADYLIILGAGLNGTEPSMSLVERMEAARAFLEQHPDCVAVASGGQGQGEDITEAEAIRRWLTDAGIAPERIIIEDKSTTTEENVRFSLELIDEQVSLSMVSVAIASSEYHIYRAKKMALKLGITAAGVAAKTEFPILRATYFMREAFALLHFFVFG